MPLITQYTHQGYSLAIVKHKHLGTLCGYIGLPRSHPLWGLHYDKAQHIEVHGGWTYGGKSYWLADEDNDLWWLGFDCAHLGDLVPSYPDNLRDGVYRDEAYVRAQLESVVAQLEETA